LKDEEAYFIYTMKPLTSLLLSLEASKRVFVNVTKKILGFSMVHTKAFS
jgi:hypothetical protein